MKIGFDPRILPSDSILLTCSSHEERCLALPLRWGRWRPLKAILFHYDDSNPRREKNHAELLRLYGAGTEIVEVMFTETRAVDSFRRNRHVIIGILEECSGCPIVFDISVFTRRHLLMLFRWLDDMEIWSRVCVVYSEP